MESIRESCIPRPEVLKGDLQNPSWPPTLVTWLRGFPPPSTRTR